MSDNSVSIKPLLIGAPYSYDEFLRRAATQRRDLQRRAERSRRRIRVSAVALGIVGSIGATAAWLEGVSRPPAAASAMRAAVGAEPLSFSHNVAQSQGAPSQARASVQLRVPLDEPAIVRVRTHWVIADLEDRLASLDDALSESEASGATLARLHRLQQQRARLVDAIEQVRSAERLVAVMQ